MPGTGPYSGMRVLDLDSDAAGAYATMLLADLGADATRADAGRVGDAPAFRLWNRSKTVVRLDPAAARDRPDLLGLVRRADVVVHTMPAARADSAGLSCGALLHLNPRLVCCAIPPFGASGPLAGAPADDGTVAAHAGIFGDQGAGTPRRSGWGCRSRATARRSWRPARSPRR